MRLCATFTLCLVACNSAAGPPRDPDTQIEVDVTPGEVSVRVGEKAQLTVTIEDAEGRPVDDMPVAWTSSDPAIAAVDGDGEVLGRAVGSAQIVATVDGIADST